MNRSIKTIVLYRVLQEWRRPIFERLSSEPGINFHLLYGPDFPNTKVVSSTKKVSFNRTKLWSIRVRKNMNSGMIAMPFSPFLFFRLIKENPQVVITEGASNLLNAFIAWIYCKIFGKKYIWWSLGKLTNKKFGGIRKIIDVLVRFLEKTSDAIISYSSIGKLYFESLGIDKSKIFVAVNVVDTEKKLANYSRLQKPEDKLNDIVNILFVGALIPQKKIDILLRGYAKAKDLHSNISLTIVGNGPEMKSLKELSNNLELDNVNFEGKVFDGVERYFMKADLFVLPGLGGLAVSEAMCYRLPVIASIGDGCEKDLIVSGKNGIIDEELDADSLAKYIYSLVSDREKLKDYQSNAQKRIIETYNVNTYLNEVLRAIEFTVK